MLCAAARATSDLQWRKSAARHRVARARCRRDTVAERCAARLHCANRPRSHQHCHCRTAAQRTCVLEMRSVGQGPHADDRRERTGFNGRGNWLSVLTSLLTPVRRAMPPRCRPRFLSSSLPLALALALSLLLLLALALALLLYLPLSLQPL